MRYFVIIFIVLTVCMKSFAGDDEYFSKIKTAIESKRGDGIELSKAIRSNGYDTRVKKLLGVQYYKVYQNEIIGGGSSMPESKGSIVHFMECKRHDCMSMQANFYIDVDNKTMSACLHLDYYKGGQDIWFSQNNKLRKLDSGGCLNADYPDEFAFYQHMNKKDVEKTDAREHNFKVGMINIQTILESNPKGAAVLNELKQYEKTSLFVEKRKELTRPILRSLQNILDNYARKNDFDIVLDYNIMLMYFDNKINNGKLSTDLLGFYKKDKVKDFLQLANGPRGHDWMKNINIKIITTPISKDLNLIFR